MDKPNPDDETPDLIDEVNKQHEELNKPVPPGQPTGAFEGSEIDLKLSKVLDAIPKLITQSLEPFKEDLTEQRTRLDQTIEGFNGLVKQLNQPQQAPPGQPAAPAAPGQNALNEFSQMPPEVKQQVGLDAVKTLADAYSSIKGAGTPQQGQGFEKMMAEWGAQMFRYHLDSMAQSVYNIRLPPPTSAAGGERITIQPPTQTPQPQQQPRQGHGLE